MRKKLLGLLLAATMTVSICGCGSAKETTETTTAETVTEATTEEATAAEATGTDSDAEATEEDAEEENAYDSDKAREDVISSIEKNDELYEMLPASIKESGKIKNGLDDAYPPMSYHLEDNTLVGFDVDFGNAIAKKLGVEIEWTPADFSGIITSVQSGQFDIALSALTITDERSEMVNFSDPYFWGGAAVIARTEDAETIKSVDDLAGKIVGVQLGSSSEEKVKEIEGIAEIKTYSTIPEELLDLQNGRVDAVVEGIQVAQYYSSISDGIITVAKVDSYPFGIAFQKDTADGTALQTAVQAAIDELNEEGSLDTISQKWFGTDYNDGWFGMEQE